MARTVQDAYIVAATRTPVGKAPRGMFRHTRPDDMLSRVLKAALDRCPGLDPAAVEDVVVGCAMPEAEQGMNVARIALLLAGLPDSVSGMTINRFCASGLQAVALAADRIWLGDADVMIAAGTESMSLVPMGGNKPSFSPSVFEKDENVAIAYGMGITAEKVARQWKISREAQDLFAAESHRRAVHATDAGEFRDEVTPYAIADHLPDLEARAVAMAARAIKAEEGDFFVAGGVERMSRAPFVVGNGESACSRKAGRDVTTVGWRVSSRRSPQKARSPRATARRCPMARAPWF
jgi:acetyl-CoA acyltransferase